MNQRPHFPLVIAFALAAAMPAAAVSLRNTSTATLPDGLIIRDVRWAGPAEVYVSTNKGVARTRIDSVPLLTPMIPAGDQGGVWISGLIGVGRSHIFIGSPMGSIGWIPLAGEARKVKDKSLLTVMDLDARSDTAAVLGSDRGPLQGLARDGTIAWTGTLSKGLSDMRPLMKGRSNPGAKDMARCSILETGAIRFMQDGTLVVSPGTEPGIYRYGADGKLMQTWDTEPLGIVDDCSLLDNELHRLARDFQSRIEWYASRLIVDDILPLHNGPALIVRRVEKGVTKWDLVTLPYRGKSERVALPVTMPTPRAHVRGDVRGNQIVLLLFDDPLPSQKPVAPPRLVLLSITDQ